MIKTVAAVLGMSLALAGYAYSIGLSADKWQIKYSRNMPSHPSQNADGSWSFNFPRYSNGEVDYVVRSYGKTIEQGRTLTMRIRIDASSDAKFKATDSGGVEPQVRFILQKKSDDLRQANGRFWSNPGSIKLVNGTYTLSVRLTKDYWTNVNGQRSGSGFRTILQNMGNIGVTFGAMFFGHGVGMESGTARFTMLSYEIN